MPDETRYAKQKRTEASKDRHASIVTRLSMPTVQQFDLAMEEFRPPCRIAGLPSPWTDYERDPELREDYESGRLPTAPEAESMCAGCPITGDDGLCQRYAKATGQSHGVWGGRRIEKGRWLKDHE